MSPRTRPIVLAAALAVAAGGCGKKEKDPMTALGEAARHLGAAQNPWAKRLERASWRAPVEPVAADVLLTYLPPSPAGWTSGEPHTSATADGGYKITEVSRHYTGNDGAEILVKVTDGGNCAVMYAGYFLADELASHGASGFRQIT